MNHREKVRFHLEDMARCGVGRGTAAPPLFHLLWLMKLPIPPPLFLGFSPLLLLTGSVFGVLWTATMWLFSWRDQHYPPALILALSAGVSLMFGAMVAGYYRWKARKLNLPDWEAYGKNGRHGED